MSAVVLIDDTQVGSIRGGKTVRFEVPPREHRLRLKIARCVSQLRTALVEEGGTVFSRVSMSTHAAVGAEQWPGSAIAVR